MGRTSTKHAWQQEKIRSPDMQLIGKSLGGGFTPFSAVLVHQHIFDTIASSTGSLTGGHTSQAHPTACTAALAVQRLIRDRDFLATVRDMGAELGRLLKEQLAKTSASRGHSRSRTFLGRGIHA